MLRFLYRLLWSLFIGLILTVWIVQNNSHVEQLITHKLITLLEKEWNVTIKAQSSRINLFTCSFFLNNGKIVDKDRPKCNWTFEQAKVHVSPIAYFLKKKIHLYVTINNIAVATAITNGQLDVVDHVRKIVSPSSPDIPVSVRLVQLNNFDITVIHQKFPVRLLMSASFELTKEKRDRNSKGLAGTIVIDNLDAFVNKKPLLQKMHGTCKLNKDRVTNAWVFTLSQHLSHAAFDPANEYMVTGEWSDNKRVFVLQEKKENKHQLSCAFLPNDMIQLQGNLPTSIALNIGRFFSQLNDPQAVCSASATELGGVCSFNLKISTLAPLTGSSGGLVVDDLFYKGVPFKRVALTLAHGDDESQMQAAISIEQAEHRLFDGTISWDTEKKSGQVRLTNPQLIKPLSSASQKSSHFSWLIKPRNLVVTANFSQDAGLDGTYTLVMLNQITNDYLALKGGYIVANNEVSLEGKTPRGEYRLVIPYQPSLYIKRWEYIVNGKKHIDFSTHDSEKRVLEGSVQFALLRSFLDQGSRRLVLGDKAALRITLDQRDFSHITGLLSLKDGKIYLPENRNLVEHLAFGFELDFTRKFFALNDVHVDFCKGRIECSKASVLFDDNYAIKMVHVPLTINNLFVNWKRDFYGFVYGNLLLNKHPDNDLNVSGTLVLKKALLKDNIFSQGSGEMLSGSFASFIPINERLKVDLHILTEQPIRARTDTLETCASVDVRVRYAHGQNIAQFPQITGTINLDSGHLSFLRNKLKIEYGKIQFITNQLNDPLIDLVARNRINKYMVTLQATGSLQKPTIILESTPELTEEQIIGLLLVGSENAKLQTDLFAMLEQNLHDIVLGSKDKLPKATTFLEKLTRPLKYVQIAPDFTDQSGRGGIKGTVSVNVNDQVRAQIQTNFDSPEDFGAQVEYLLADDVSVKGVKDQRGGLGAEVEVRFKL